MTDAAKPFEFTEESLNSCDAVAAECLGSASRRRLYPELQAALYASEDSELLLVCRDGNVLFMPEELGVSILLAAFKNGLRTDRKVLYERGRDAA